MEELVKVLKVGDSKDISNKLQQFLTQVNDGHWSLPDGQTDHFLFEQYGNVFTIPESLQHKKQLMESLFRLLRDPQYSAVHPECLQVMRIITRDKSHLAELFSADRVETMLHLAMLVGEEEAFMTQESLLFDGKVVVEAQKCLCNLIYNCPTVQKLCANNSCIEGIMLRLRMHPDPQLPQEVSATHLCFSFCLTFTVFQCDNTSLKVNFCL